MVHAFKVETRMVLAWSDEKNKLPVLMVDAVIRLINTVLPMTVLALHDETDKLDR